MTPQSAGINMQSPQSDLTPWTLTIDRIENRSKSKTAEIETAKIKECLNSQSNKFDNLTHSTYCSTPHLFTILHRIAHWQFPGSCITSTFVLK